MLIVHETCAGVCSATGRAWGKPTCNLGLFLAADASQGTLGVLALNDLCSLVPQQQMEAARHQS